MSFIFIKDNFFTEKVLNHVKMELDNINYNPPPDESRKEQGTYWFDHELPILGDVQKIIIQNIKDYFNIVVDKKKLKAGSSLYILSNAKDHPRPHTDEPQGEFNCLIYIKGNKSLVNGTGFYDKVKDLHYDLNTNVGFKENRAIFFSSNNIHSSMQWQENSSWRHAIANFFYEDK
jgi:hypothetical protein